MTPLARTLCALRRGEGDRAAEAPRSDLVSGAVRWLSERARFERIVEPLALSGGAGSLVTRFLSRGVGAALQVCASPVTETRSVSPVAPGRRRTPLA